MRSVGVHRSLGSSLLCISCQYSVTTNTPSPPCNKTEGLVGLRMDFQSVKWISRAGGSPRAIFPPSTAISARTYHRHHNKCLIQLSEDETFPLVSTDFSEMYLLFGEEQTKDILPLFSLFCSYCFVLIV